MQLRVSDLLNDLHERTDLVEDRIEGIESKINHIQKAIDTLPEQIATEPGFNSLFFSFWTNQFLHSEFVALYID